MASERCGMHLCGQCALITLVFGIIFLLDGLKVIAVDPWILVGAYLGLLGLYNLVMKK